MKTRKMDCTVFSHDRIKIRTIFVQERIVEGVKKNFAVVISPLLF